MEKLPLKIEHDLITEASFDYYNDYYDDDYVVEIPVVKTIKVKFNKPIMKVFEI